ncbi:MAG: amino acid adenylation domain-containing protein, partial [Kofleriaceae bacterium]|nr:amino acid adenylation domain-containing protein [Kofleriaceae bacterium]
MREVALGAYSHQDAPFERVVEALRVPRDTGRSPLFQVMFVHQREGAQAEGGWGTALTTAPVGEGAPADVAAKFELALIVTEHQAGVSCVMELNTELFDTTTVERMLGHYQMLLEGMSADPACAIGALPLLTEGERQQLVRWNATARDYPREACLHELFEAQVDQAPASTAVVCDGVELTYAALDRRANQLAHQLRTLGVGPEVRVGICVRRSVEMVVGVLGILKAGGAYVPLDPSYPAERLAYMLEDATVPVVVAHGELAERVTRAGVQVVRLDGDGVVGDSGAAARPPRTARGANAAYVIYTSGSTGRPKGVVVEHRMAVNMVLGLGALEEIQPRDRVLQFTSLSFDPSVQELFTPLVHGATAVVRGPEVPSAEELLGPAYAGVTIMNLTTAYWHALAPANLPTALRLVVFGGERALPAHVRTWSALGTTCRLLNLYGPTEGTIAATGAFVAGDVLRPGREVPIGRPLPNYQVHVLDERGQPVPVGVPGELYIGGAGVARGYLDQPALTAERFVAHPGGEGRVYRTGDKVRWFADGQLEYLGRIDQQVKIRGFRIELGEIESVLAAHPAVGEVAVMAREDAPGDKRLVAYVIAREGEGALDVEALRTHLAASLPAYMVPSAFVMLDALPLTPNGKLDLKALPAPDVNLAQREYAAPRTEVETLLTQVWSELLGVERVGVHDDFFALGGHSLLVMRLVAWVRKALGVEVSMRAVFEAPTPGGLAEAIGRLSAAGAQPLVPVSRAGALVASFGQQRFWLMAQLAEGAAYDMSTVVRLRGALDVAALARAVDALVERHEVLRTTLVAVDDVVVQRIAPADAGVLKLVEVASYEAARAYCADLCARPYDLTAGPLFAPELVRIADDDHVLVLRMHHAVGDEWSMEILRRELGALYQGKRLTALAVQYADFATWQRSWVTGDVLAQQLGYWSARLGGAEPLALPTDRPRPAVLAVDGVVVERTLPLSLGHAVEAVGRAAGATPFMTYLAAFYALLHRYTQQTDISIGTPVANRGRAETEALIGYFLNTVVLRADLSDSPSFETLLAQVRDVALGAYAHQDAPFELVVEALHLPRDAGRSPLFQVMFVHQHAGDARDASLLTGITEEGVGLGGRPMAKFELTLQVKAEAHGVLCQLEAKAELHDATTLERMLGHFEILLEGIVAMPARSISELPLLSAGEQQQLAAWNATTRAYPRDACLHELFEAQADRTPDAVALVFERAELTYRELDERANQLAHHLRALGVGPEVRVGLCVRRTLEMMIGVLGILKAGGAYVPLDPNYPADRLAFMIEDAATPVVIAHSALADRVLRPGVHVVRIDADGSTIDKQVRARVSAGTTPANLAYVIYTSGSTGRPKGVMVEHRNVTTLAYAWGEEEQLTSADRVLQMASLSFDGSVLEIFPAWLFGATLVLRGEEVPTADELFGGRYPGVTVAFFTTAYWHTLVGHAVPSSYRLVSFGGERVSPAHVRTWLQAGTACATYNGYGPTECTAFSTVLRLELDHVSAGRDAPIGAPLPNYKTYVLDARGMPVPIGVVGELYIGGDGVARGYLDRPELTAAKFIANPFASGRLYRTGDLARWLPNGLLEFHGRADTQVKLRGYRIELGEIEAVLLGQSTVRDAAVVMREDQPGDKRLVAYVVGRDGALEVGKLRAHVSAALPDYMVPSAFVLLDALPLTTNGKLDRRALPAPDVSLAQRAYVPPQGAVEELLAQIWCELLGLTQVGRNDHFFELGGQSLLSIRMMAQLRRRGWTLDVKTLFATPTLAALAEAMTRRRDSRVPPNAIEPGATAITPAQLPLITLTQADIDTIVARVPGGVANIQDIYALMPLQEGMLFHHQLTTEGDTYLLVQRMAFPDRALLDRYLATLQQVVDRHDVLRTSFCWEGLTTPAQVVWRTAPLRISEVVLAGPGPEAFARLAAQYNPRHYRIDLTRAPLMELVIAQEPGTERWLVIELWHHIINDHESLELMRQEIDALFAGGALPPSRPFRNLVAEARFGQMGEAAHERYFRSLLGDIEETTAPFGLAYALGSGHGVAEGYRRLPDGLAAQLRAQARRLGVSVATLCHVAWGQVIARTSGREQVVFGTVLFGRMHATGADRAIGMYLNTLPIRLDLDASSVEATVRRTHATLAELMAHEHAPLSLAQRCSRVAPPAPLFSSLFNYRHNAPQSTEPGAAAAANPLAAVEFLSAEERTNYAFDISVDDDSNALTLSVQVVDSISPDRVCAMMVRALEELATALEHAPHTPVRALDILPPDERRQLLVEWNATTHDFARDVCLHELFEAQADERPEAVAVELAGTQLTYQELDERANQLAHHLRALGVGPEQRVGLCVERRLDMFVALIGILKAGGAYVPVEPTSPSERIASTFTDAGVSVAVIHGDLVARVTVRDVRLVAIDTDVSIAHHPRTRPVTGGQSNHLAYVIYTSGSTGRPKGVEIEHGMAVNEVLGVGELEDLGPGDRVLQFASLAFDTSVDEIFATLSRGATLVVRGGGVPTAEELYGPQFAGVTVMNVPTAYWHALATGTAPPASLRLAVIGGERALPQHMRGWLELAPRCAVLNVYGPTETTIAATAWQLRAEELAPGREVPIGRPLPNYTVYVLDAQGALVPIGVPGELYIGGAGVARGYLGRPELTAEKFVDDPFGGGRMYRTGDQVRWLANGTLEYLGRLDQQVKVRGFRIELGEIESVLAEHASVREVAVMAREHAPGDTRLVAYVVGHEGAPDVATLRAYVAASRPEYMVPSAFVVLDALPVTPNGKLDRKALPAPDLDPLTQRDYVAPRTAAEELLAGIWCQLMGVERVGVHDNFFELGGHSLLVMKLVARVRRVLSVELSMRAVFEAPTLGALAEVIGRTTGVVAPPLVPVPRGGELVASFGQQRFWVLAQLEERDAYHMSHARRLRGSLDIAALARAMDALVARHEVLRTTLAEVDGHLVQRIAPARPGLLAVVDVATDEAADAYVREAIQRPFDLTAGPLFAPTLVRIGAEDHVLLLRMHHVVGDEWSQDVLSRELAALYRGEALAPLVVQYADFAAWQRAWLVGDVLQRQLDYWHARLAGVTPLELPTDRPRPTRLGNQGAWVERRLPAAVGDAMDALGRAHGTTPFMTYLAAFYVLLQRYSHQDDIAIGTPVANRGRAETDALIGYFLNTVVLRADLSGTSTFETLLAQVREVALGAYAHQDAPFDQVLEALRVPRDTGRSPLFQVMFVHQPVGAGDDRWGSEINIAPVDGVMPGLGTAKFELSLFVLDGPDGTTCAMELNTELFETSTIERMLGHYQTLLEAIVAAPTQPLAALPLLTEGERQQLAEWNATAREYPRDATLQALFEAQTDRTPDSVAVVFEEGQLTYRELDERANKLAHHLRGLGVGPDRLVAIFMERTLDLVIALYAVHKAGGAYVPLDPNYPEERVRFIQEDAASAVVLTQASLAARLPSKEGAAVVVVDHAWPEIARLPRTRPASEATGRNLSHVIYTSGSTGRPKGVAIEHRSVVNFCHWAREAFTSEQRDGVLFATSICFDLSVFELFATLAWGGRVVLVENAMAVATLPASVQVRLINTVPSVLASVLEATSLPASVRTVNLAGEPLKDELVARLYAIPTVQDVYDLYGPSETTTYSTYTRRAAGTRASIGRPLANTQVYVLDAHRQLVPPGGVGELYIGGVGVARGYLNRPDLTTERFIADTFAVEPGARMYRTGDLARWQQDGTLEYLGRLDHQVKVRGFRIELGEIEAALAGHPSVREVVVLAREDVPGDKRLVAYVVGRDGAPDVDLLGVHVAASLPAYMVPSAFVVLDALPVTPNGKLDRKALPAPDLGEQVQHAYVAPRTEPEALLAGIWCELLRVARVGVHDNFFALGGHSLLVMKLVARVRALLSVEIPVRAVFEAPTLGALAEVLGRTTGTAAPPLVAAGRDGSLVASFGQQRFWVMAQLSEGDAYDMTHALRLRGRLDVAALAGAVDAIVARHEVLRTTLAEDDGRVVQRIAPARAGVLAVVEVGSSEEAEAYVREVFHRPYDLTAGPLFAP